MKFSTDIHAAQTIYSTDLGDVLTFHLAAFVHAGDKIHIPANGFTLFHWSPCRGDAPRDVLAKGWEEGYQ